MPEHVDYSEELRFWDETLEPSHRHPWMVEILNPETRQLGFPGKLLEYVPELRTSFKTELITVLDVGSGPLSPLAWGQEHGVFRVVAVDPLAEEYESILEIYGLKYPVVPTKGGGHFVDVPSVHDRYP